MINIQHPTINLPAASGRRLCAHPQTPKACAWRITQSTEPSKRLQFYTKSVRGAATEIGEAQLLDGSSPASRQYSEASQGPPQFFEQLCGRFEVNQEQMDGFQDFSRSMRQCSLAFFLVSATNIILTISQTKSQVLHQPVTLLAGVTVGNFAFWADSLLVAVLLHYGANSFNRVTEVKCNNQLPFIFQGLSRLSMVFTQFGVAALSVAVVHLLEAAARHPPITKVAAALFFAIAGIRSAALWWIMSDSSSLNGGGVPEMLAKVQRGDQSSAPRWERFAMRLVVGHLLAYNVPGLDREGMERGENQSLEDSSGCGSQRSGTSGSNGTMPSRKEYKFTDGETQMLRICIDAMHTAGLAFIVQGISTMMLGIANFLSGNSPGGVSMTYNGLSKSVTAALLFKASSSFDAAVTKPGCNVTNMLSAIGPMGLTKLWNQLTVFAWTVSLSQVAQIFMPILNKSPLANFTASKIGSTFGQGLVFLQNVAAGLA